MKLYIANTSQQVQNLQYRLPETRSPMQQTLEVGQQKMIGRNDMSQLDIDAVVAQLSVYGLVAANEVDRQMIGKAVPYIYSVDKTIPTSLMHRVIMHNRGILVARGKEQRLEAAIATSQTINEVTDNNLQTLEMAVTEDRPGTMEHQEPAINEGVRVEATAEPEPTPKPSKHARRNNQRRT